MKKAINILVSVIFLMGFIGIQVHKHYSHGKLFSTAIYTEAESCCEDMETCEMTNVTKSYKHQKQNNCSCKDETETYKLNSNFVVSEKQKIAEMPVFDILATSGSIINIQTIVSNNNIQIIDISPPLVEIDTQSEFGVFLC